MTGHSNEALLRAQLCTCSSPDYTWRHISRS